MAPTAATEGPSNPCRNRNRRSVRPSQQIGPGWGRYGGRISSGETRISHRPVAVVGGGPAGLMAAEVLANGGAQVTVYEHRRSMGRKLLLAGRSGLNLTNERPTAEFLAAIDDPTGRVAEAIRSFGPDDLRDWANGLGQPTFAGSSGRVFPEAMRATPLLRAWLARLGAAGVEFRPQHRFAGWADDGAIEFDVAGAGQIDVAHDAAVFALGGGSWPGVGSDGAWATTFADAGIGVDPLRSSNAAVEVRWSDALLAAFEGTPVKGVRAWVGERSATGDLTVTRFGLEGTPAYSLSSRLGADSAAAPILSIDLVPDRSHASLAAHLDSKRRPKDSFATWIRRASIAPIAGALVREVTGNAPPADPIELATILKELQLVTAGVASLERAISSAGGVDLTGVGRDFGVVDRPGTFVAGEMLGFDAPTGGWLLQVAFSTGVAAGRGALGWLGRA